MLWEHKKCKASSYRYGGWLRDDCQGRVGAGPESEEGGK